jgi:hypothetical protein
VVISPNIDFNELSTTQTTPNSDQDLGNLRDALGIQGISQADEPPYTVLIGKIKDVDEGASKWESNADIL